jgi:DNA adenine methylase
VSADRSLFRCDTCRGGPCGLACECRECHGATEMERATSGAPKRPVVRYHGGKWLLAQWIIGHFPAHRVYVEPFGGGGSVLLQKDRSYAEVYNDLDMQIVNLFRVLRDETTAAQLCAAVRMTPFSRVEFREAYTNSANTVEQARRTVVRGFMGFGSAAVNRDHRTGFRANSNRSGTTPARDWVNWPDSVPAFVERMRGVVIENKYAAEIITQHDTTETLFYLDPPYPFSTRSLPRGASQPFCYRHEMTDEQHRALAATLHGVAGMVVLSGYPCSLYDDELYPEWHRVERKAFADGASERTEVLWLNPAASRRLGARDHQHSLDIGAA